MDKVENTDFTAVQETNSSAKKRKIRAKILSTIRSHESISLTELSDELGIAKSYLSTQMKIILSRRYTAIVQKQRGHQVYFETDRKIADHINEMVLEFKNWFYGGRDLEEGQKLADFFSLLMYDDIKPGTVQLLFRLMSIGPMSQSEILDIIHVSQPYLSQIMNEISVKIPLVIKKKQGTKVYYSANDEYFATVIDHWITRHEEFRAQSS